MGQVRGRFFPRRASPRFTLACLRTHGQCTHAACTHRVVYVGAEAEQELCAADERAVVERPSLVGRESPQRAGVLGAPALRLHTHTQVNEYVVAAN